MKYTTNTLRWFHTASLALLVCGGINLSQAQPNTNLVVAQFDTASDPFSQVFVWWGGPVFSQQWDGTQNNSTTLAPNTAGSGSLKITADWSQVNTGSGAPQPQLMLLNALSGTEWNQSVT